MATSLGDFNILDWLNTLNPLRRPLKDLRDRSEKQTLDKNSEIIRHNDEECPGA